MLGSHVDSKTSAYKVPFLVTPLTGLEYIVYPITYLYWHC